MRDIYGAIARARAAMMVRGHAELAVHIGSDTMRELRKEVGTWGPFDLIGHGADPRILFMRAFERDDMEGWVVLPDAGHPAQVELSVERLSSTQD